MFPFFPSGELAPCEMMELMEAWGVGKHLARLLMSVYGGHPEVIFHALQQLQKSKTEFCGIEGFPGNTTSVAAQCVRAAQESGYPGMMDILNDMTVIGVAKLSQANYIKYGAATNLIHSLRVGRTGFPGHVIVGGKDDAKSVDADFYWTIPSTQYMRVALAWALALFR